VVTQVIYLIQEISYKCNVFEVQVSKINISLKLYKGALVQQNITIVDFGNITKTYIMCGGLVRMTHFWNTLHLTSSSKQGNT